MTIDLTLIPPPNVVDYPEFEVLFTERRTQLIELVPAAIRDVIAATLELESEPLTIGLQADCYRELLLRQRINEAIKATFLASATGADLEQFAAGRGIERKVIQAANPNAIPPIDEVLETDTELRLRCQLFPEKLAAAGPREAYYAHALDASVLVADAQVVNADSGLVPPGTVRVYIKTQDGTPASGHLVSVVADYLSEETRRPLCDTVQVMAAVALPTIIAWSNDYEIGPDKNVAYQNQQEAIRSLVARHSKIGTSLSLSKIIGALDVEGIKKVTLSKPSEDLECNFGEFFTFELRGAEL